MIEFSNFSKIVDTACTQTILDFIDEKSKISTSKLKEKIINEEVFGPSIEVNGSKVHYSCILQYKADQNLQYIDLLTQKYPFIDSAEAPDLDILDLLGEFLNILCGKINKELESVDKDLNIEIPYFTYGIDPSDESNLSSTEFVFGELSFKLHYYLN